MFDKLKRMLFGPVYNGPDVPAYPDNQGIRPISSSDDPQMGFVYAGPDPFVRVDGPAYPENQIMGVMAPAEEPLTVYAGPDPFVRVDEDPMLTLPGIPAPPPPTKGYIRLDHPEHYQQREISQDRKLTIGRTSWEFPIPQEMQPTISREHCSISYIVWMDCFIVTDLNSTNGIFSRDMVWEADGLYAIGGQAFDKIENEASSNLRWQQFGHRLPAGKQVVVSPGTSLRIGTMPVTLWSEKNHERWG